MMTKYGELNGIEEAEFYQDGKLMSCKITEPHVFKTAIGELVPQYETRDERRKVTGTIQFYENGDLMSISLDEQIKLQTSAGEIPAEKILFYEGEKIKRIFPLNGKLSGYWGEENEYGLAEEIEIKAGEHKIKSKFISIAFSESGNVRSLTFWPRERVELNTKHGKIKIRKGISFYENMAVKSFEPANEFLLLTPIGVISAFNNEINGLNGDINSIQYYQNGKVKSLYTCNSTIKIVEDRKTKLIVSELKPGWCNELVKFPVAVKIDFIDDIVVFNEREAFNMKRCKFEISKAEHKKIAEEIAC